LIDAGRDFDWVVGDEIVIASTDFEHKHAETFRITAVDLLTSTFTLNTTAIYRHVSGVETVPTPAGGTEEFPMRAEVGLLTRNILIQGDEENSIS